MTEEYHDHRSLAESREALSANAGRRLSHANQPSFTGADVAAFVVSLIMVCGPLAMGAFGV